MWLKKYIIATGLMWLFNVVINKVIIIGNFIMVIIITKYKY